MRRRQFLGTLAAATATAAPEPWSTRLGIMCQLGATESGARGVLAAARAAGFTRAQVAFPWDRVDEAFLKNLPAWVQAEGLRCEALGAYVNCVEPVAVVMNTRTADFERAIAVAAELACPRLVAWTGGYKPGLMDPDPRNFTPAAEDAIVRFIETHARRLESAHLRLALESYITLACPDAPALKRLLARLPNWVGAVMDPPNLTPLPRYPARDAVLREMFATLQGRITLVHLKDFRLTADGRGYDLPGPLAGVMNYPLLAQQIRTLPPDTPVLAEHIGPKEFAPTRRALLAVFRGRSPITP
ncbi:MAG TPA: TIM barrel protein [Paludibaculum sp.]|jgi:sugar phosphate isomerase/epimerase